MFERFTEKAIKAIMLAQEEARRLGHNFVGTEQMLLGLIGNDGDPVSRLLKDAGCNIKDVRREVEIVIGRGAGFVAVEIPFTPRAKKLLEEAWNEARNLSVNYIGTEHLLLGLLKSTDSVALRVLNALGANLDDLRSCILNLADEAKKKTGLPEGSILPSLVSTESRDCPNCAEIVKSNAVMCRFCGLGLSLEHYKKCSVCAEMIRQEATKCRFCSAGC